MANPPFFSIVTIILNSEKYLAETIENVICQDYPHKEHIIIDGGSKDGTLDIIKNYESHVRWISEKDRGISDAMNKGIRMAKGNIISHLHSDDIYKPGALKKVADGFLKHPERKWLVGNGEYVNEKGERMWATKLKGYSYKRLTKHNYLFHPSVFINKEVFSSVGYFDSAYKYAMDYDMWLRISSRYEPIFLKEVLSSFRVHGGSITSVAGVDALDEEYKIRIKNYDGKSLFTRFFYFMRYCAVRTAKRYGLI